jgi:hypothetical protein
MAASLHHIFNRDISKVEASSSSDEKEPTASSVEQVRQFLAGGLSNLFILFPVVIVSKADDNKRHFE